MGVEGGWALADGTVVQERTSHLHNEAYHHGVDYYTTSNLASQYKTCLTGQLVLLSTETKIKQSHFIRNVRTAWSIDAFCSPF